MSKINYSIELPLADKLALVSVIKAQVFPMVNQAVHAIAEATAIEWEKAVRRAKLRGAEKDAYIKTISFRMPTDFSAVIESDYKYVQDIETGRPAYDMKKMLDTSRKVRVSKDGARYLIIPFRHNTPGNDASAPAMPKAVYAQAKMLSMSTITGHGRRVSGTGAWSLKTQAPDTVRQRSYNWGDRLMGPGIPKNQQGMVRMNTATGAGKKSSTFLTFRVMSEKSHGWIRAAQPGQNIAKGVAEMMQPRASAAMVEAIKRTMG
jgi:hypothetical protein